jgi:hypothetical protein
MRPSPDFSNISSLAFFYVFLQFDLSDSVLVSAVSKFVLEMFIIFFAMRFPTQRQSSLKAIQCKKKIKI